MRVAVTYPPFTKKGLYPLLSQNRQFRYTNTQVRIYPLIPSYAASQLKNAGHEVLWLDGINERLTWEEYNKQLKDFKPGLLMLETKAPIVQSHWKFIDHVKKTTDWKITLVGDHVSFFPEESFGKCSVDYVLTGGDYDVSVVQLADFLDGKGKLPAGTYYRENGKVVNTGRFKLLENMDSLPFIDRELTKWNVYGEAYLYWPSAYVLSGRGCGVDEKRTGLCTFCIWQYALWDRKARLRSAKHVVEEIKYLYDRYKIAEVFDDNESGGIWDKKWLHEFYTEMDRHKLIGRLRISTNARSDSLDDERCRLMKETGFRLLKVGLESGSDDILRHICKDETVQQIIDGVMTAKRYGLVVRVTTMVGYPWETEEDVRKTYEVSKKLLSYKTHCGDSIQSSIVLAYPGTPMHKQAAGNNWLLCGANDYESYDMSRPVIKTNINAAKWCTRIWKLHYRPVFMLKTLFSIRSWYDIDLILRGVKSLLGHEKDFTKGKSGPGVAKNV